MTVKKTAAEKTAKKAPVQPATRKQASRVDPVLFARENGLDERSVRNLRAFKGTDLEAARFFGVDEQTAARARA